MNKALSFPVVLILAFLAGCAELPRGRVQFDVTYDCPEQSDAELAAEQDQLGPRSDTQTIACALIVLQGTQDPLLRRSALGSRLYLYLAERETGQKQREKLAANGVEFAEAALAQGGQGDGELHYYLAANLGLVVRNHITLAVANLGRLEDEMKQAVALSPDIDDGGPLRLLGALYLKAPAWPNGIGDLDKALELLKMAVMEHPAHPLNHLFYAQALWAEGNEAGLNQVKAELALGEKLLAEGNWGYSKAPWEREFAEFEKEIK